MNLKKVRLLIGVKTLAYIQDFARLLEQEYQLLFATQCSQLLEIAREKQADLILLEDALVGMESMEMCSLLKTDPRTQDIPVIIITGSMDEAYIQNLNGFAVDYLHFPDHPAILKAHLRTFLELKHYRDLFASQQTSDPIANILDWPAFEEHFNREWRRAIRYQAPQSLIILSIDFLDAFNELYGGPAVVDCLRSVEKLLLRSVQRVTDYVARYGNDEYSVLLTETDTRGALKVAVKIIEEMAMLNIPHEGSLVGDHVTLSIGLATLLPTENQSPSDLILLAQDLLHEAKRNGYNQVQFIDPENMQQ